MSSQDLDGVVQGVIEMFVVTTCLESHSALLMNHELNLFIIKQCEKAAEKWYKVPFDQLAAINMVFFSYSHQEKHNRLNDAQCVTRLAPELIGLSLHLVLIVPSMFPDTRWTQTGAH